MPESRRGFVAKDVERLQQVGEPDVSPDGSQVVYTVTCADVEADSYRSHLWLLPLDGGEARQLTRGKVRDSAPRWSPDGNRIAFVRAAVRSDASADANDAKPQIWLLDARGGEPWQLSELASGAASPVWAPDGRQLAFLSRTAEGDAGQAEKEKTPAERNAPRVVRDLVFRFDGAGIHDDKHSHIWLMPADGGEARQITSGDWDDGEIAWSPNGREIAFTSYREADRGVTRIRDIWVADTERGECRRLTRGRGPSNAPVWSPDGQAIAYAGHEFRDEGVHTIRLNRIAAAGGDGGEPQVLSATLDRSVAAMPGAAGAIVWSADGQTISFLAFDCGTVQAFEVEAHGGEPHPRSRFQGMLNAICPLSDGSMLVAAETPECPGELHLVERDGTAKALTRHNADWLNEIVLSVPEEVRYSGADGWEMHGFLMKPIGYQTGERYPLVLSIHGGPHGQHGLRFQPGFQALSSRGYAVLFLNPRGSIGYGEDFCRGCMVDWGGKDYEDLMLGVDWAIAQGIADPERLFVTGYSYGGFMTSWVVGHTDRFRAAVCGAPFADARSMFGTSDISSTGILDQEFGGVPWEADESYRDHSPTTFIHRCTTPLLLLHWEGDLRCPIGQSEQLFATVRKLGRECVLVRYPGGSHGSAGGGPPSQRIDFISRTADWFDAHASLARSEEASEAAVPA